MGKVLISERNVFSTTFYSFLCWLPHMRLLYLFEAHTHELFLPPVTFVTAQCERNVAAWHFWKMLEKYFLLFWKILSTILKNTFHFSSRGHIRYKISTVYSFHAPLGILHGNQLQNSQNSHFMSIFLNTLSLHQSNVKHIRNMKNMLKKRKV